MKRQVLLAVAVAATIAGCGDYDPAHLAAMNTKLAALDTRVSKLETAAAAPPATPYVLWQQELPMQGYGGTRPVAQSGYPSKAECEAGAALWPYTDGGTPISTDPLIYESKKWKVILRCLPQGISPWVAP